MINFEALKKLVRPEPMKPDPEIEAKRQALKTAYLEMMSTDGWKHFKDVLADVKESPVKILDEKILGEVTLAEAGFIKGVRSAITSIEKRIGAIIR